MSDEKVLTAYSEDSLDPLADVYGQDWSTPSAPTGEAPGETFTDENGERRHVPARADGAPVHVGYRRDETTDKEDF